MSGGGGSVFFNTTGATIPANEKNRDWLAYQAWLAVPNIPDAETQSLEDLRSEVEAMINSEAEDELAEHRPSYGTGSLSTLSFETLRREAVAATAEGSPWAAGYPFLAAQVGTHGADVGAVATYWTGIWTTYETAAKEIEEAREIHLAALDAAASFSAVRAVRDAVTWPEEPEPAATVLSLVAPDVTLSGPTAAQTFTPDAAAAALVAAAPLVDVPLFPDPSAGVLVAPEVSISIA